MEFILLPVIIVGWALTALMIAAVVSDLSKTSTRLRGRVALGGAILLTVGPLVVEAVVKSINAPLEAMFLLSVTFGAAAMVVYVGFLVASAISRYVKRHSKRDNIAV